MPGTISQSFLLHNVQREKTDIKERQLLPCSATKRIRFGFDKILSLLDL